MVGQLGRDSVDLQLVTSPLLAKLDGPSGDVRRSHPVLLTAENSTDPDDPANDIEPMQYFWTCSRPDDQECFWQASARCA